ncbi:MAG: DUF3108 domain-containing protein [Candidatus Omnitrophota bacterium]
MRFCRFAVLAVFVCFIAISIADYAKGYEVSSGEELVYSARFLDIIPFGDVKLKVEGGVKYKGNTGYLITCEAGTAKWISLLFKANAVLKSYIDKGKLLPYKFEQILKVAGKEDDIRRATYDRANNIMDAEGKGRKKVPADVRDPISAIYFLRTQKLSEGAQINQTINNNQANYIFSSMVSGKKNIGGFDCWVLDAKVRRENKSMYHSMDVVFYISDTKDSIPVLVKAKTKVGPLSLKLKRNR